MFLYQHFLCYPALQQNGHRWCNVIKSNQYVLSNFILFFCYFLSERALHTKVGTACFVMMFGCYFNPKKWLAVHENLISFGIGRLTECEAGNAVTMVSHCYLPVSNQLHVIVLGFIKYRHGCLSWMSNILVDCFGLLGNKLGNVEKYHSKLNGICLPKPQVMDMRCSGDLVFHFYKAQGFKKEWWKSSSKYTLSHNM